MYERARLLPGGDRAIFVDFGNAISPELNRKVQGLVQAVKEQGLSGIEEMVPTYRSVLVYYDPLQISFQELKERLMALDLAPDKVELPKPRLLEVPTVYGGEYGPDLDFVAQYHKMSVEEVIKIHTGTDYLVYFLGFIAGFVHLGGLSEKIATPRLDTPRARTPRGSVGIGGKLTGVYPVESPGGWRLIGKTPIKLFAPNREPPVPVQTGDYVRFVPISEEEFHRISREIEEGTYQLRTVPLGEKGADGHL